MLSKLALQNIKEKKFRTFLACLSIAIGTASIMVFLGLSSGIKNATFEQIEKKNPLTQITVRANNQNTGIISFLSQSSEGQLNEETLNEIKKINNVKAVYPEIQYNNFASLEAGIFGVNFVTDTMVFGLPKEFISDDLKKPVVWDRTEEPYPALIPRKILDLYNLTVSSPQNLPRLSEESLIGKSITLFPDHSSFFPTQNGKNEKIKLEVVGFSDKLNLIGITIPYQVLENLNQKYSPKEEQNYLELFVETTDATETAKVAQKIENLGHKTQYYQKKLQDIEAKFIYLNIALGIISLVILITSSIAIVSTFLATVAERSKEIGLFRALGATKKHIRKIILTEAGLIGIAGSLLGLSLGLISSKIINHFALKELAKSTFKLDSIFLIDLKLMGITLVFGTTLSIISAYLPARKASNTDPIKALSKS